jgi:predicted DNA binding protein
METTTTTTKSSLAAKIADRRYKLAGINTQGNYEFRKVLLTEESTGGSAGFAEAEVVTTADAILADKEIDLVIMPESEKNNLEMVSLVLNSGKNLRIV